MNLSSYVRIARPDHWFKNALVLPGTALGAFLSGTPFAEYALPLAVGMASVCLVASANYVINEWLDAEFDAYHPLKRQRPSAAGRLSRTLVYTEYALLLLAGLGAALVVSPRFLAASAALAVMGILYNVQPFRTKDRQYLDVLSESINNPIRLLLGWFMVIDSPLPPSSLLAGYWMAGAYLMAVKRYAELRFLGSPEVAGSYRRSFRFYTEESLLISILFYACCAAFLLGVFLVKYRIELLISLPFLAVVFAWYLRIGMKPNSPAQAPEQLWRERGFALYLCFVTALVCTAFAIDVPWLDRLLEQATLVGN